MVNRRDLLRAAPALCLPWALAKAADEFPSKPLRYIVPVAAGGGSDFVGRTICERWGKELGQTIIVDNQSGAGGIVACQTTRTAKPDGYTLMQGYVATHGTSPATRHVPYDPIKDFTPIGMIGGTPNVLVVNSDLPVTDLKGFVDYLKKNPGKWSYGSAGPGSLTQLVMELFKQQTGTAIVHIPYRGIAPAFNDLLGGQTQAMFPGLAAAMPHLRSGRVRPLAITGAKRQDVVKDVPTLIESGYQGFDALQWYGVVGPAGMPPAVTQQLNQSLARVLAAPDLKEKLAAEALDPMPMSSEQFGTYIRNEVARWTALAKARNIRADD